MERLWLNEIETGDTWLNKVGSGYQAPMAYNDVKNIPTDACYKCNGEELKKINVIRPLPCPSGYSKTKPQFSCQKSTCYRCDKGTIVNHKFGHPCTGAWYDNDNIYCPEEQESVINEIPTYIPTEKYTNYTTWEYKIRSLYT